VLEHHRAAVSDTTKARITSVEASIQRALLSMLMRLNKAKQEGTVVHPARLAGPESIPEAPSAGLPRYVGPWGSDEKVRDRWTQVGVETSAKLFENSISDAESAESVETIDGDSAKHHSLDDVLVSVKKAPPPSRAYFQQAILTPLRLSAQLHSRPGMESETVDGIEVWRSSGVECVNVGSAQPAAPQPHMPGLLHRGESKDFMDATLTPLKAFVSRLPFSASMADVTRVMQQIGGPVSRIELWPERAQYFERVMETQEAAAASRAKWQDAHRKNKLEAETGVPDKTMPSEAPSSKQRRFYKVVEERRQKYANQSPLCAFVYFASREGFEKVCTEDLRLFGIVIKNQACKIEPAGDRKVLHLSNLPKGMTADAVSLSLNNLLHEAHGGARLSDKGRLRHGVVCNGDVLLEFPTHTSAVRAALLLRGTELTPGNSIVVGWALGDEWRQARPRLPAYF
jgi:hypothetical protein